MAQDPDTELKEQAILNRAFNKATEKLKVESESTSTAIEYDASGNAIYIGKAGPGATKAQELWQIKKLTYDASGNCTDIQFASGSLAFDKIWNSRTGYNYS